MNGENQFRLAWNRPALQAATEWLARDWDGSGPLDLTECLVVVQTRRTGRRLRASLARLAADRGRGVLPPRTVQPASLFKRDSENGEVASDLACLLGWAKTLGKVNFGEFPEFFSGSPDSCRIRGGGSSAPSGEAWFRDTAKALHRLRRTLSEAGCDCASVARESFCPEEPVRWKELAELERRYLVTMTEDGLRDPFEVDRESAREPVLPDGIERVILLGLTGFSRLVETALVALREQGVPIGVAVFGPEASKEFPDNEPLFDEWGRPLQEAWHRRTIPIRNDNLVLLHDERAQASELVRRASIYGEEREGRMAVGVVDSTLKPFADSAFSSVGTEIDDPEGEPGRGTPFHIMLSALGNLVADPSLRNLEIFIRLPEARTWLQKQGLRAGGRCLLEGVDRLRAQRLPRGLEEATELVQEPWPDLREDWGTPAWLGALQVSLPKLADLVRSL